MTEQGDLGLGAGPLRSPTLRSTRTDLLPLAALASAIVAAGAALMVIFYAPVDAVQGVVQKIFYLHVPAAIAAYLAFAVVLGGGLVYLWNESAAADRLARVAAEVGLVLTTVALIMGSLWAKPIWGTYWEPADPRLVSTLALWLIYAGYLLVRRIAAPGRQASRFAAIVGIVGFIDVPIVHFSVSWWRTIHPPIEAATPGAMPPAMLLTFAVSTLAVLFGSGVLLAARYREAALRERLRALRSR